jgi:MFS family permease
MQGVIIAYMLTVALLIPASGWIADRFGTKKIFFGAILLFSIGSLLCAVDQPDPVDRRPGHPGPGRCLMLPVGRLVVLRLSAFGWCGSWVLSPFPDCSAR